MKSKWNVQLKEDYVWMYYDKVVIKQLLWNILSFSGENLDLVNYFVCNEIEEMGVRVGPTGVKHSSQITKLAHQKLSQIEF